MKVYSKDSVYIEAQSILELVFIFILFTLIVIFLYRICKMKEERLAKESKIFEQLYTQLQNDSNNVAAGSN